MMLARVQQPKSLLKQIAKDSQQSPSIKAQSTKHLKLGMVRLVGSKARRNLLHKLNHLHRQIEFQASVRLKSVGHGLILVVSSQASDIALGNSFSFLF